MRLLPGYRCRYWTSWLIVANVACAPRPYVVTEPPRVAAERTREDAPRRVLQWYNDFWRAIANVNIPVAWTLAESREERTFAEALQSLQDGEMAEADSTLVPLLNGTDTLVRRAARVTYGALLSSQSEWGKLAAVAPFLNGVDTVVDTTLRVGVTPPNRIHGLASRDAAGVASWAPAFASARTTVVFANTVVVLPFSRAMTGVPVIEVRVNGVVKHFWLDTGSSISILSSSVATECAVNPVGSDTLELLTAVGRIPARPAIVRALRVGSIAFDVLPAMIVDTANLQLRATPGASEIGLGRGSAEVHRPGSVSGPPSALAPVSTRVDGILGIDIIRHLDLTIDDAQSQVIIRKPVQRPVDRTNPRNLFWFGVPIVTLLSERGIPLHFSLDTGAEETYGVRTVVAKARTRVVQAERRMVNGFGTTVSEPGLVVPRMRLFVDGVPLLFQRVFLYNARYPTIFDLDGTLGSDVGRGGTVRIDMTNGRFEVTP